MKIFATNGLSINHDKKVISASVASVDPKALSSVNHSPTRLIMRRICRAEDRVKRSLIFSTAWKMGEPGKTTGK
jgi:hypothetical protein